MSFPLPQTHFPASRAEALRQLEAFLPGIKSYASRRNFVEPPYTNVSRLSPATRTRLILEREICAAARRSDEPEAIEKFEQEVWWRLYWKGWLERRPLVWREYRRELGTLPWSRRAHEVAAGESGVAIIDWFTRELMETGYLHNHARMWWASYWIHVERLPWQIGAEFFLRHLLDGDAASNTLSWRWVAGLHTAGKSYLVRRSNLERYVAPDLLNACLDGLARLENPLAVSLPGEPAPEPVALPTIGNIAEMLAEKRWGLWLHDEDLLPEISPLSTLRPHSIRTFAPRTLWAEEKYSPAKQEFLHRTLSDGIRRAGDHFQDSSGILAEGDLLEMMTEWAKAERLEAIVTMHPFVGPLRDRLPTLSSAMRSLGIDLMTHRRPEDISSMKHATGGFFRFWKNTAHLR